MSRSALNMLFDLPRPAKRSLQVLTDLVLLSFSFAGGMWLRTESFAFVTDMHVWWALLIAMPVTFGLFIKLGFYRAVIRYVGGVALRTILYGVGASALALAAANWFFGLHVPATVPILYAVLAFCTVGGVRFALRGLYLRRQSRQKTRVIIYGAGQAGRQLVHSLAQGPDYAAVAFVDDSRDLHGTEVAGLKVLSPDRIEKVINDLNVKVVLLAVPSTSLATRAQILARLEKLSVRVQTIPGMADLVSGRARISEVRAVTVEDLLGREPVPPSQPLMRANIAGKSVLVTGAGGTIGSELCRQILLQRPETLVLLELSEFALYSIDQELRALCDDQGIVCRVVPLLGSVRDGGQMEDMLREHRVQTIYHAAAYKHVPLVEENVVEGLRNNVFGTLAVGRAAVAAGVDSFILVSTDKAVRPTNVMGASKRLAELVCQGLAAQYPGRTRFAMVRFGNVLGSSGSVIPLFRRQIAQGGPVTVTHPEITRYFMTITEAAQLVIQAGAMAKGGDLFVLDMGNPIRIADLARRMIRLSGFIPVEDQDAQRPRTRGQDAIAITYTRLRKGEKLFEELLIDAESRPTLHPRILTATETAMDWTALASLLEVLSEACRQGDPDRLRQILCEAPLGYQPAADPSIPAQPAGPEIAEPARRPRPAGATAPQIPPGAPVLGGAGT